MLLCKEELHSGCCDSVRATNWYEFNGVRTVLHKVFVNISCIYQFCGIILGHLHQLAKRRNNFWWLESARKFLRRRVHPTYFKKAILTDFRSTSSEFREFKEEDILDNKLLTLLNFYYIFPAYNFPFIIENLIHILQKMGSTCSLPAHLKLRVKDTFERCTCQIRCILLSITVFTAPHSRSL